MTAVGRANQLGDRAATFLTQAAGTSQLHVVGPLGTEQPVLGYAFASAGAGVRYVVYAESDLPPGGYTPPQPGSPFGDLNFALYLGPDTDRSALLETNSHTLPLPGHTSTATVPFGDTSLTLVASAGTQLGGNLIGWLWWIVAVFGVLLAAVAALTTENLVRRRRAAEQLTADVAHLLNEQRSIAETLQHALLPQQLPDVPGVEFSVRYLAGSNDVEIGGDWYDVIPIDERRCFFVVGDVSGRGVAAGAVMASLNFAIRGFVTEGHQPAVILGKLTRLLDLGRDAHFATVLCGLLDVARHEITLASAGHLPPLVIAAAGSDFVTVPVGPPVGVATAGEYRQITIAVPAQATLLAYTDGLVERRDESLDDGLARLQRTATAADLPLDDLVSNVVHDLLRDDHEDDTAILGVRWRT
jgi:serine phosphatase RsbU (regulator of sigma subunit)